MSSLPPRPVVALEYALPPQQRRPGILTAVGVISIVVGALSVLGSIGSIFSAMTFTMMSRSIPAVAASPAAAPGATATLSPATFSISPTTTALVIATGVAGLILAVLILVAGIMLLRDARLAARLHWIWVFAKIPIAIIAAIASGIMQHEFMQIIAASAPGGSFGTGPAMIIGSIIGVLIALAYPIALIFVLRAPSARMYFSSLEVGA